MAVTEIKSQLTTVANNGSSIVAFTLPANPGIGNLMVATFSYKTGTTTITTSPSGWTNIIVPADLITLVLSWKISDEFDARAINWNLSSSVKIAGTYSEYTSDGVFSFDASVTNSGVSLDPSTGVLSSSSAAPPATTNILLISAWGANTAATFGFYGLNNHTAVPPNISSEISEVTSTAGSAATKNTCATFTGLASPPSARIWAWSSSLDSSQQWATAFASFKESGFVEPINNSNSNFLQFF